MTITRDLKAVGLADAKVMPQTLTYGGRLWRFARARHNAAGRLICWEYMPAASGAGSHDELRITND